MALRGVALSPSPHHGATAASIRGGGRGVVGTTGGAASLRGTGRAASSSGVPRGVPLRAPPLQQGGTLGGTALSPSGRGRSCPTRGDGRGPIPHTDIAPFSAPASRVASGCAATRSRPRAELFGGGRRRAGQSRWRGRLTSRRDTATGLPRR